MTELVSLKIELASESSLQFDLGVFNHMDYSTLIVICPDQIYSDEISNFIHYLNQSLLFKEEEHSGETSVNINIDDADGNRENQNFCSCTPKLKDDFTDSSYFTDSSDLCVKKTNRKYEKF